MLEVCASKIGDIILSVLESKMENKLDEVKKAKIISDTRKSICEFEEKYLQNHNVSNVMHIPEVKENLRKTV